MAPCLSEMTNNMQTLYYDIVSSLGQLPLIIKSFLFGSGDKEDIGWVTEVANYITLEFIKYSYDSDDPEYSL